MLARLFVYGSLLSGEAHEMGARLAREAELLGPATLAGRLYRISWYPGLVDSDEAGDLVHGEVFELRAPVATLAWLDDYEGVARGPASAAEDGDYARVTRTARLADGRAIDAWVYLYRRPTAGREVIASGRWSDRPR